MKIAVILENPGGELERKELIVDDDLDSVDLSLEIEEVIEDWILGVGDTIRIIEE